MTEYVTHFRNESKSEPLDPDYKSGIHDMSDRGDITLLVYSSSALCSSKFQKLLGSLDPPSISDVRGVLHANSICPSSCMFHPCLFLKTPANRS